MPVRWHGGGQVRQADPLRRPPGHPLVGSPSEGDEVKDLHSGDQRSADPEAWLPPEEERRPRCDGTRDHAGSRPPLRGRHSPAGTTAAAGGPSRQSSGGRRLLTGVSPRSSATRCGRSGCAPPARSPTSGGVRPGRVRPHPRLRRPGTSPVPRNRLCSPDLAPGASAQTGPGTARSGWTPPAGRAAGGDRPGLVGGVALTPDETRPAARHQQPDPVYQVIMPSGGVIVSGPLRGAQQAYALMEERVRPSGAVRRPGRDG